MHFQPAIAVTLAAVMRSEKCTAKITHHFRHHSRNQHSSRPRSSKYMRSLFVLFRVQRSPVVHCMQNVCVCSCFRWQTCARACSVHDTLRISVNSIWGGCRAAVTHGCDIINQLWRASSRPPQPRPPIKKSRSVRAHMHTHTHYIRDYAAVDGSGACVRDIKTVSRLPRADQKVRAEHNDPQRFVPQRNNAPNNLHKCHVRRYIKNT